jgi:Tfp pilus assembly protein PilN
MIRIDLLPLERQRKERTPLPRFMAMNAAIIICMLLVVWNIFLYLDTGRLQEKLTGMKKQLANLLQQTEPYDRMIAEEKKLDAWNKSATEVKNTRSFLWWEKIDEIWDVIYDAKDIWITSLEASDMSASSPSSRAGSTKTQIESSIKINCLATGASSDKMTNFRIKLKNHSGLKETFDRLNEPPQFQVIPQPDYQEGFAVKFDIELSRELKQKK